MRGDCGANPGLRIFEQGSQEAFRMARGGKFQGHLASARTWFSMLSNFATFLVCLNFDSSAIAR